MHVHGVSTHHPGEAGAVLLHQAVDGLHHVGDDRGLGPAQPPLSQSAEDGDGGRGGVPQRTLEVREDDLGGGQAGGHADDGRLAHSTGGGIGAPGAPDHDGQERLSGQRVQLGGNLPLLPVKKKIDADAFFRILTDA